MALQFDESTMAVNPLLSVDLGVYSAADGSAQTLSNGNYFFQAPFVVTAHGTQGRAIEINSSGAAQVLNVQGPEGYRGWQMPSLYSLN
jgi:hypothetical protein